MLPVRSAVCSLNDAKPMAELACARAPHVASLLGGHHCQWHCLIIVISDGAGWASQQGSMKATVTAVLSPWSELFETMSGSIRTSKHAQVVVQNDLLQPNMHLTHKHITRSCQTSAVCQQYIVAYCGSTIGLC